MDSVASAHVEAQRGAAAGNPADTLLGGAERPGTAVSVVATVLNEVGSIEALLASLFAQTLAPVDIVIVDGGSEDGTWERLEHAAAGNVRLTAVRDESCNRRSSEGPIARGRNVAIARARGDILACADAGCSYPPDWLDKLSAPLLQGTERYALGGAYVDARGDATVWDVAAAPFFGVKLAPGVPQRSCTARSMAFRRELWEEAGGFPEAVPIGEDTIFDARVRALTPPSFVPDAKALYQPRFSWRAATEQLWRYSVADGALRLRPGRLTRNGLRCALECAALACLPWTRWPLLPALAVELYCAVQFDGRFLLHLRRPGAWLARLAFSAPVPWLITVGMLVGRVRKVVPASRH